MSEILNRTYAVQELSTEVLKMVKSKASPSLFFRGLFADKISQARGAEFFVKKYGRDVAVDVSIYATEGNVNRFDKQTQKDFIPPFYYETCPYSAHEAYQALMNPASSTISKGQYVSLTEKMAEDLLHVYDKLDRTEELLCSQALYTGTVTVRNGNNIDFKREAGSMKAYNSDYDWGIDTVNPDDILIEGAQWLVSKGYAAPAGLVHVIMGNTALQKFQLNPIRKAKGDIRDQKYMTLSTGRMNGVGAVPQGTYSAGSYTFILWSYPEIYKDPDSGADTNYANPYAILMLPEVMDFEMFYGAVPEWSSRIDGMPAEGSIPTVVAGKRVVFQEKDIKAVSMANSIKSAPLPLTKEVNKIFVATVAANNQQVG